jgi:hypothetical protein
MGSIIPIIPFAIDACTTRDVAISATTINRTAPTRSDHGARLKNSHQARIANEATSAPSTAMMPASGRTSGTTNLTSPSSTAAATPGHSRSGLRIGPSVSRVATGE